MNRYLYFLCIILCFIRCNPEVDTSFEYTKSLVNKTDKVLFYAVRTTAGSDSAFSYGHDSIEFYFVHRSKVSLPPVGPYHIDIEGVSMREERLYNLTDTSFFRFNLNRNTWNGKDSIYWDNITYSVLDGTNAGMHERHFETLTFQDILFTVMQKDYGMLDKFREYYDR
ncbi:MAG: hypothetical protein LBG45_07615 [Dysgonamonadaceae bacterium]|nr:hypothetical protein [Dysgonamonadaceae bacterium]